MRSFIPIIVVLAVGTPRTVFSQVPDAGDRLPTATERVTLSGPRFGVTFLGGGMVDSLKSRHINVGQVITQFGWQFEKQFLGSPGGLTAISEWVLLVGGLDQGAFLPTVSWLVGVRAASGGAEIGVGPNVSPAGAALAIAGGFTHRQGSVNLPFSVAVVPSKIGTRVSLLIGFTMR